MTVTNTPGVNSVSVAELALGLIFAVVRGIPVSDRRLRAGVWQHPPAFELQGKTLGLLGLGAIGSRLAQLAQGLGMRVVAWSWRHDRIAPLCWASSWSSETISFDGLMSSRSISRTRRRSAPASGGTSSV